jgi:hypothetical protein
MKDTPAEYERYSRGAEHASEAPFSNGAPGRRPGAGRHGFALHGKNPDEPILGVWSPLSPNPWGKGPARPVSKHHSPRWLSTAGPSQEKTIRKAISWSARQIAANAGDDGSIVVGKTYAYGYDAQTGEYGNLVSKGIIDPTKVVRAALQGAASVAALLITTEAMVAELPKKESAPPMPGGGGDMGGMGGMGGMDF